MKTGMALLLVLLLPGTGLAGQPAPPARHQPVDCLLEPNRVIDVSSAIRGVLEQVDVDRGDLVEEGQVVAYLDSSVERAALDLAVAAH